MAVLGFLQCHWFPVRAHHRLYIENLQKSLQRPDFNSTASINTVYSVGEREETKRFRENFRF